MTMKAKYIGNNKNMTTSKVYEVEQYVSANDPVYGNTFAFTDDFGVRRIDSKDNFLWKNIHNERYNQIIDEAWKKYLDETRFTSNPEWLEPVPVMDVKTGEKNWGARQYHKNDFINKCKTDTKFSERWGLKIEERKLSLGERGEIFRKEYPNKSVDDFAPGGMEVQSLNHQLNTRYNNANIPTKLLTVIYNNEILDVYE